MGDVIGGIFGTSTSTTQQTIPDEITRAQNLERLNQLINLMATGGINQFATANPEGIYTPTNFSTDISNIARNNLLANQNLDYGNILTLDEYRDSFTPTTQAYQTALAELGNQEAASLQGLQQGYVDARGNVLGGVDRGRARAYQDYGVGLDTAGRAYATAGANIDTAYRDAVARGDYDLARTLDITRAGGDRALNLNEGLYQRGLGVNEANLLASLGISEADVQRSLATQDANRARALELGIGATGNYIDQIARPRLEQALALQGLERGGAVPAGIARATAETAMPYLQSVENTYGVNQANTLNALMALRGELTGNRTALDAALGQELMRLQTGVNTNTQNLQSGAAQGAAQGNVQLGGQRLAGQTQIGSNYQNNVNQLAQALMANNISLEQAGISADSALGQQLIQAQTAIRTQRMGNATQLSGQYIPTSASFAQSLPEASAQLSLLPGQMQANQAAYLTALQPIADFPRQLSEADYLRRQGLFTTAYTGIPYTPGSTVFGGSATGNIFDQLGGTIQSGLKGGGNIGG